MMLGVIADDFTGATDVASMLVRAGMRTVQTIGIPGLQGNGDVPPEVAAADAVVVALKSRTTPPAEAIADSLAALRWLQAAGARQFYFKVCSTFDSTPAGNIGPVAEALMAALGTAQTLVCPAFPENGRTVFRGHLFVGDELLSDSGMRNHPLTPMSDSNLVRWMQRQSQRRAGLLRHDVVARGAAAVTERLAALQADGIAHVVADAVDNDALRTLAEGAAHLPLWVAGSGLALGLPAVLAAQGAVTLTDHAADLDPLNGKAAVLAGSCSTATQAQVARWIAAGRPALRIDPLALARGEPVADEALAWARAQSDAPLLYATADAATLAQTQAALGVAEAGALVEHTLARIARGLVDAGTQRLVVAGGETSGAVVQALDVRTLRIGAAICPGVPWTQAVRTAGQAPLKLALKSGNFGGPDFFTEALVAA
ncbi:MAG TPA: four-carbon acid sugar kinase family protein [Aquabacterium sp.]|nr:four-carbon acid sugar kinase family protein [Aquabacterium sp.]